ncbi:class I SAM-dependent methyltransferase [Agromyces sp. MMS24-JH15]|uniref:class I SAM-dependent methyltransferase n=1 Tax=Agromyces sp. MMS24-JH15 TaxID=3243765 RepID=UPI0037481039
MDLPALRGAADAEAAGLDAADAADRLILDEAREVVAATPIGRIAVIGDAHGALAIGALSSAGAPRDGEHLRVHQDALLGERAIVANAERLGLGASVRMLPLAPELVRDARVVLLRLPRSLDQLDEVSGLIADHADPAAVVFAGGRIKHMTPAMNDVLRRRFGRLDISHARQKSRVLIAREPIRPVADGETARADAPHPITWPRRAHDDALDLDVVAHGGAFAGASVDIGTRFLVGRLPELLDGRPAPRRPIDLACGTGVVAVCLARLLPTAPIEAYDQSAAAVASARLTAAANGVGDRVRAERADGLELVPDGASDLVVLNPPFHSGAAITTALAERLFADAGRALAPGGRLVAVWNSHLRYRAALERAVGPTRQVARDPKFTVTVSTRR